MRPPQQARSRASWERVLDEGVALLEDVGYDGLTVAALCERAGVTSPTVYARAGNKEQLLLAIYEHAMARIGTGDRLAVDDPRWHGLRPEALMRRLVDEFAHVWLDNVPVLRATVLRAASDPAIWRRGQLRSQDVARRFRAIALQHLDRVATPSEERAVDACLRIIYAALVQRVMYGEDFESDVPLGDAELVTTLGDIAVRYLGIQEEEQ